MVAPGLRSTWRGGSCCTGSSAHLLPLPPPQPRPLATHTPSRTPSHTLRSHGHYVAHIRDEASGQWWRFDDETATLMGAVPTSHPGG